MHRHFACQKDEKAAPAVGGCMRGGAWWRVNGVAWVVVCAFMYLACSRCELPKLVRAGSPSAVLRCGQEVERSQPLFGLHQP